MAKHTAPVVAAALLLIVFLLAASAQCRIIVDDGGHDESEKINLPNGLCVYKKGNPICKSENFCYCCLAGTWCYETMDGCKQECGVPPGPPS
ncbi:hypothetical protein ACQ4PT_029675 [Festuca glaucescens]